MKLSATNISDSVNETPYVFEVDIKKQPNKIIKFLKKLNTKRVFTVKPVPIGILLKVTALVESIDGIEDVAKHKDFASLLNLIHVNGQHAASILSIYTCGSTSDAKFFLDNLTLAEMDYVLSHLIKFSKLESFFNSIILMKRMSLTMTEEIIAPSNNNENKTPTEPLDF